MVPARYKGLGHILFSGTLHHDLDRTLGACRLGLWATIFLKPRIIFLCLESLSQGDLREWLTAQQSPVQSSGRHRH